MVINWLFSQKRLIIIAGIIFGVIAAMLVEWGNPSNMGLCLACFWRDIAGAIGLHRAGVVQYIRPEILGLVLGSLLSAHAFREFRSRGGSAPIIRFMLGAFTKATATDGQSVAYRNLTGTEEITPSGAAVKGPEERSRGRKYDEFVEWLRDYGSGLKGDPQYWRDLPEGEEVNLQESQSVDGVTSSFTLIAGGSRWFEFDQGQSIAWIAHEAGLRIDPDPA